MALMSNGKTPISALQELMAARKLPSPIYIEENTGLSFKCTVHAAGITAVGLASNKKSAKHDSAKNALDQLRVTTTVPTVFILNQAPVVVQKPHKNYVGELNEFASKRGLGYPQYDNVTVTITGEFYIKCSFLKKETFGMGLNKKDGKQDAAQKMLEMVSTMDPVVYISDNFKTKETKFEPKEKDVIINLFKCLSTNNEKKTFAESDELKPVPGIEIDAQDSLEVLKFKLQKHGIEYSLEEMQKRPCIIFARIKGTDLYFGGHGSSREAATREALKDVLEAAQSGISLSTNSLISLN